MGISVDLEPVGFPRKDLFDSYVLESGRTGVKPLWQRRLLYFLIFLETLSNTCHRSHSIHDRWLVEPWHPVRDFTVAEIQKLCLDALRDLAGLTLKVPLEDMTACRNNWYCAAKTFLWETSSSPSSVMNLSLTLSSESRATEKFTGEASLGGDSDDDNVLKGERDRVDSLDSSMVLARLPGVLGRLTGILGHRSGVLDGVLDFLGGVSSSLGVGVGVCATDLAWASGAVIPGAILRCMRVHIDMKSINVVWLMVLGSEGKSRLLTSDNMDESCPAAGVFPAGVLWATGSWCPAGSSTASSWWCAGLATHAGSSSWCAGPSIADPCWSAGSSTSAGPSTISGSSSSDGTASPADPSLAGSSTAFCCHITVAGSSTTADPSTSAGSATSFGQTGKGITVMVLLSGDGETPWVSCTSRLEIYDDPDFSELSFLPWAWWWPGGDLQSTDALNGADRDLRSTNVLWWCWWWWVEEPEGRISVALAETQLDPGASVESACLLELDRPDNVGWAPSPLSRLPLSCLDDWWDLGESWRLLDPWESQLQSPLHDLHDITDNGSDCPCVFYNLCSPGTWVDSLHMVVDGLNSVLVWQCMASTPSWYGRGWSQQRPGLGVDGLNSILVWRGMTSTLSCYGGGWPEFCPGVAVMGSTLSRYVSAWPQLPSWSGGGWSQLLSL